MFRPLRNVNIQYRGLPVCKLIRCQLSNYWQTSVCMWARESPVLFTDQRSIQPIFTIIYSCTELAPIIPSKKKKKGLWTLSTGSNGFSPSAKRYSQLRNDICFESCHQEKTFSHRRVLARSSFSKKVYWMALGDGKREWTRRFRGWPDKCCG